MSDLPRTFADAVVVTRALGFANLWIDSLCIVQGDEANWQRESANMLSVYADSAVTIAAAAGENSEAGLFGQQASSLHARLDSVKIEYTKAPGKAAVTVSVSEPIRATPISWFDKPGDYLVLYTRAWALQERVISRRVLGFGKYGICYFQCDEVQCADYLKHSICPKPYDWGPGCRYDLGESLAECTVQPSISLAKGNWYAIVDEYSSCYLTEGRDKLPAISGIAQAFETYIQGPYLAGLWQSDLIFGLTWTLGRFRTVASLRPARFPTPSWSWISSRNAVRWGGRSWNSVRNFDIRGPCTTESARSLAAESENIWVPCLDVVDTNIQLLDMSNPFGEVKQASLTVSGKLRPIPGSVLKAQGWQQRMAQASSPAPGRVVVPCFDSDERPPGFSGQLWSLLVCLSLAGNSYIDVWGLILEKVGEGPNEFRRLGLAHDTVSDQGDKGACRVPEPLEGEYSTIILI